MMDLTGILCRASVASISCRRKWPTGGADPCADQNGLQGVWSVQGRPGKLDEGDDECKGGGQVKLDLRPGEK